MQVTLPETKLVLRKDASFHVPVYCTNEGQSKRIEEELVIVYNFNRRGIWVTGFLPESKAISHVKALIFPPLGA